MNKYVLMMVLANLIAPLGSNETQEKNIDSYSNFLKYIDESEKEDEVEEILAIVLTLRDCLIEYGCPCPALESVLWETREDLELEGIYIADEDFYFLLDNLQIPENLLI